MPDNFGTMTSSTPPTRPPLTVVAVDWAHPDAVTLREEMAAEVGPRYADLARTVRGTRNAVDESTVHRTFVAYSGGPPVTRRCVGTRAKTPPAPRGCPG